MERITFPKIGEKHKLAPLLTAEDALSFKYKKIPKLPYKNIAIIYSDKLERRFVRKLALRKAHRKFPSSRAVNLHVSDSCKMVLVKMGIGAPITALEVEELIAMGAKNFIIFGSAGGIGHGVYVGDIITPNKALRDEGVSHHYLKNSTFVEADKSLFKTISKVLKENDIQFKSGPTWTSDAPYRETRKERDAYASKGILTIEMEAAALFAVARARGARAAAVFAVSDSINKNGNFSGWPKNRSYDILTNSASLIFKRI